MLTGAAPGLKLLDFGIAKLHDAVRRSDAGAVSGDETTAGVVLGTPAYMSPEQVAGAGEITDRADVYAVGILLFRMVTAQLPFQAASPQQMMMRHLMDVPPDARTVEPSVPEPLAQLIARCLQREPGDRPRADAVAAELRAWADQAGVPSLERLPVLGAELTVPTPRRRARPA
jgi:serine/threonine-protein kinase